jgi:hypothetical protein
MVAVESDAAKAYIDDAARMITKSAVTSRMVAHKLEGGLPRFINYPVRFTTQRRPRKATVIIINVGPYDFSRVVEDQRAAKIMAAARTLVKRAIGEVAINLIFELDKKNPRRTGETSLDR